MLIFIYPNLEIRKSASPLDDVVRAFCFQTFFFWVRIKLLFSFLILFLSRWRRDAFCKDRFGVVCLSPRLAPSCAFARLCAFLHALIQTPSKCTTTKYKTVLSSLLKPLQMESSQSVAATLRVPIVSFFLMSLCQIMLPLNLLSATTRFPLCFVSVEPFPPRFFFCRPCFVLSLRPKCHDKCDADFTPWYNVRALRLLWCLFVWCVCDQALDCVATKTLAGANRARAERDMCLRGCLNVFEFNLAFTVERPHFLTAPQVPHWASFFSGPIFAKVRHHCAVYRTA